MSDWDVHVILYSHPSFVLMVQNRVLMNSLEMMQDDVMRVCFKKRLFDNLYNLLVHVDECMSTMI